MPPARLASVARSNNGGPFNRSQRLANVPATEVAQRRGRDVAVLLKIYANCIDGQGGAINDRITAALAINHDHETLPAAPAVDLAAQPNPRARAKTVGSGPGKTAGQPS